MNETIAIHKANYFSELMLNYVDQEEQLRPFYTDYPTKETYLKQAKQKLKNYPHRKRLVERLTAQLDTMTLSDAQINNLALLANSNTVTITTGHQLNLFSGPIFFFYKLLQIVRLCKEMNAEQTEIRFVPIFWMATEDHDFEEINHFYFEDRKIVWEKPHGGPVGRLSTTGLQEVFDQLLALIPNGQKKTSLKQLIDESYLSSDTLTDATRKFIQALFGEYGLLMIDGDDSALKKVMIPTFEKELMHSTAYQEVLKQNEKLTNLGYPIQVNPREINLFYIADDNSRERIILENDIYTIHNTPLKFTADELITELKQFPEKFSPNVILRPLYQETILPNIAYIGGGGELAYWLQLNTMFRTFGLDFPILTLRNSVLIRTEKQYKQQLNLGLSTEDLFTNSQHITQRKAMEESNIAPQLPAFNERLKAIFEELEALGASTDVSFTNMIQAQKAKQLKGFEKIQQRLIRAEVREQKTYQERVSQLLLALHQENSLQERHQNFADFPIVNLPHFIEWIYENLLPFEQKFLVMTLNQDL